MSDYLCYEIKKFLDESKEKEYPIKLKLTCDGVETKWVNIDRVHIEALLGSIELEDLKRRQYILYQGDKEAVDMVDIVSHLEIVKSGRYDCRELECIKALRVGEKFSSGYLNGTESMLDLLVRVNDTRED